MRRKRWVVAPADREAAARVAASLNIAPLTGTLLANRGIRDAEEARRFLKPDLMALADPLRFAQMGRAVDRLEAAVRRREKVALFGDYDVDGAAGTAILVKLLRLLECPAVYRVPHRLTDGYGLNASAVRELAAEGAKVLVTVDCGTGDGQEIDLAGSLGMDVIVVDHHEPPAGAGEGAAPLATINPKVEEAGRAFRDLCASGVSFKLAWALADRTAARRRPGFEGFILDAMGLAALGTIADVCPLLGENRVIVHYGLDALRACRGTGLRALVGLASRPGKAIETFDVGFKLAPRLNALGRVGSAVECVDLLVTDDQGMAERILKLLEKSNRSRKDIEGEMFAKACERVEREGAEGAIVLADERWHPGVAGIVAARLVERYCLPSFVMTIENGLARGSARSIEGFALHEALASCGDLLISYGGHAMAAGLAMRAELLPEFQERMRLRVAMTVPADMLGPRLDIDAEASLAEITRSFVREMERLAPHGRGNPEPVLAAEGVRVAGEPKLLGKRAEHLSFYATQGGVTARAVGFGMGEALEPLIKARTLSLAFTPRLDRWRGEETVELHLKDVKIEP